MGSVIGCFLNWKFYAYVPSSEDTVSISVEWRYQHHFSDVFLSDSVRSIFYSCYFLTIKHDEDKREQKLLERHKDL